MLRRLGRTLARGLWIATTPLCLAVLLARPSSAEPQDRPLKAAPVVDSAPPAEGPAGEPAEEHEETNPIENFMDFKAWGTVAPDGHKVPAPFSMALLNFAVLLFLVGKYGGPNIAKYTRDRHDALAKALSEGSRLRDEAKAKLDEYSARLASLDGEIGKLSAEIRAEAESEKQRIIREAQERAERMKKDAEEQIAAELQRVRVAIEREAVQAAVAAAEKILREKTTDADQKQLADAFINKVRTVGASA